MSVSLVHNNLNYITQFKPFGNLATPGLTTHDKQQKKASDAFLFMINYRTFRPSTSLFKDVEEIYKFLKENN